MQVIDGKLYPPMAAKVKDENGKYRLSPPATIGVWQQSVEDPSHLKRDKEGNILLKKNKKTGVMYGSYDLNKGNGKTLPSIAYAPYEHSSNVVLNDQFEEAYQRPNIVTVECIIPKSEMTSGYRAPYAKDATGILDWKEGVVARQLSNNHRKVYLSRYLKPVRILSDAETAQMYKQILDNEDNVTVPFNVVTPGLLAELEKLDVPIDYEGSPNYRSHNKKDQYEIRDRETKAFQSDIDDWIRNGRSNEEKFVLGYTGDVLQGLGAIENDIYMNGDKINTILSEHEEMSIDVIKKIPEILNDPALVLKSKNVGRGNSQNSRLVMFGSVKAKNGQPVMAILDLRPVENGFVVDDMQKVNSTYTKDNAPVEFIRSSDVLYADKKRTTLILRTVGFQMPIELIQSGYIGSISYIGQNVNIQGKRFSDIVRIKKRGPPSSES